MAVEKRKGAKPKESAALTDDAAPEVAQPAKGKDLLKPKEENKYPKVTMKMVLCDLVIALVLTALIIMGVSYYSTGNVHFNLLDPNGSHDALAFFLNPYAEFARIYGAVQHASAKPAPSDATSSPKERANDENVRMISLEELAQYDGSDETKPIYISFMGEVFDVSSGKTHYGKGTGYNVFAGRDATRAFVTGCFKEHRTHDLRGLSDRDIKSLEEWLEFYRTHKTYKFVGKTILPVIEPDSPIPAPCKGE